MILAATILSSGNILVELAALVIFCGLIWFLHDEDSRRLAGTIAFILIILGLAGILFGKLSLTIY